MGDGRSGKLHFRNAVIMVFNNFYSSYWCYFVESGTTLTGFGGNFLYTFFLKITDLYFYVFNIFIKFFL